MMIRRRRFMGYLLLGSMPLLSSCGNLFGPPPAGTIYPVNPDFAQAPESQSNLPKVSWALSIVDPGVAPGLNTDRIALIQADGTMDYYASATYPQDLPLLVQAGLLTGFENSGRINSVQRDEDALHTDYQLLTEVKDFQAHYSQPDGIPQVNVTILAKLVSMESRKIIGSFSASQTQTASSNTVLAVTEALRHALALVVTSIVNWTLTAPDLAAQ